jgi:hypothetical protein
MKFQKQKNQNNALVVQHAGKEALQQAGVAASKVPSGKKRGEAQEAHRRALFDEEFQQEQGLVAHAPLFILRVGIKRGTPRGPLRRMHRLEAGHSS